MVEIVGPPRHVIRNGPISRELRELLRDAAEATGIDKVIVVSGGQTSNHAPRLKRVVGGWIGSRRHDDGRAADIELIKGGRALSFTDSDGSQVADFVTAAAEHGATGIGAGEHYMGRHRIHVGFGRSADDHSRLTWGAAGSSRNAPRWLRDAALKGWGLSVGEPVVVALPFLTSATSIVTARDGLWLRRGPGLGFDRSKLLEAGTTLMILGMDGDWARVDLEGDGRADGHVFAAFLGTPEPGDAEDGIEEVAEIAMVADRETGSRHRRKPEQPVDA
jgi:hypothetical protein